MKTGQIFKRIGGIVLVLAFLVGGFSGTFILTAFVYTKFGFHPTALVSQLVNSLLGLFFCFLIISILGFIFRSKRREFLMSTVEPIIKALERIAQGDFDVRLENELDSDFEGHEPVNKLVQSVNSMALELSQMEELRQEFTSNVSHEIQSPLTSIRGFARALQNEDLSQEEKTHYLNIIETESMRLSKLSEDLLKLASLETANLQFETKLYRLDKQIRNLILACEPQWMDKAIDMDVSLEEVSIIADEDLLSQVWINLIHNSIKFSPQSAIIRIVLRLQGEKVLFSISDTGIGISDADQARVFERFFKADKSRQRSNGGSGLGLSIAHKIVEIHQGEISLQSKLGTGTTVTVLLPVMK
jgi:two-component system, OmpR family, phosphate regulon sensor histidine kinase PhoR